VSFLHIVFQACRFSLQNKQTVCTPRHHCYYLVYLSFEELCLSSSWYCLDMWFISLKRSVNPSLCILLCSFVPLCSRYDAWETDQNMIKFNTLVYVSTVDSQFHNTNNAKINVWALIPFTHLFSTWRLYYIIDNESLVTDGVIGIEADTCLLLFLESKFDQVIAIWWDHLVTHNWVINQFTNYWITPTTPLKDLLKSKCSQVILLCFYQEKELEAEHLLMMGKVTSKSATNSNSD